MVFHLCLLRYYVIHFNAHCVPPKTSLILLLHEYSFRSIHVFTTSIALHPFQHLHVSEIIFLLPEAPPLLSLLMEFASQVCYYEFVFFFKFHLRETFAEHLILGCQLFSFGT